MDNPPPTPDKKPTSNQLKLILGIFIIFDLIVAAKVFNLQEILKDSLFLISKKS